MKKVLSLLLVACLALSMLTACGSKAFAGGTFKGEADGFGGKVVANVTISADKVIETIEVEAAGETAEIGGAAITKLVDTIVSAQTTEVDTVAGATISSKGLIEAVNVAIKSAGLTLADLNATSVEVAPSEDMTTDVVVIGAGGAGMTAAITAAQEGKSVVILEKAAIVGGNTSRATGGANAAKTTYQDENTFEEAAGVEKMLATAKEKYPELSDLIATVEKQYNDYKASPTGYFDSQELFVLDTLVGGKNINNRELVETMVAKSSETIDWLDSIGAKLHSVGSFGGASVKRIHKPVNEEGKTIAVGGYLVKILSEKMDSLDNVTLLTETAATSIVMTDGAASGVVAKNAGGEFTINAKSVVIATGGFGANADMVVEYKPELAGFTTTNVATVTGDGIAMAKQAGANLVDMEQIQIHPTVEFNTSALITEGLRGDGAILVNQKGERFCDEVGTRDAVSASIIEQEGSYAYLIIDQKMVDASAVIGGYISKGFTVEGATIADLAKAIGADAATLEKTISTWNGYVSNKKDADFDRTSFTEALDTANYYAIKIAPGVHHTMGGVQINTKAEVLSTAGEVIPGLFAAGEVTGGVHGANRLGGNAVIDIEVFGKLAGESAAAYIG